jgi:hypothetical protein
MSMAGAVLIEASASGFYHLTWFLLALRLGISAKDAFGTIPLMEAAASGHCLKQRR